MNSEEQPQGGGVKCAVPNTVPVEQKATHGRLFVGKSVWHLKLPSEEVTVNALQRHRLLKCPHPDFPNAAQCRSHAESLA